MYTIFMIKKDMTNQKNIFLSNWLVFVFLIFAANYAVTRSTQLHLYAQSCLTKSQIQTDSRCLYIYGTDVYEIGSKTNPHRSHPCGMDVTSIMPNTHFTKVSKYLTPQLAGSLCPDSPEQPLEIQTSDTPIPDQINTDNDSTEPSRFMVVATLTVLVVWILIKGYRKLHG